MSEERAGGTGTRHGAIVASLARAQKSNRGAPAYTRFVNRPLGRHVAAVASLRALTPSNITALSAGFTFAGVGAIAALRPSWWSGAVITALLASGHVLDSADGQLARLQHGGTPAGEWLDHVVDCIKCASIHLAVLICWFRFYEVSDERLLLVPLAFAFKQNVFYFAIMLSEQLRRARPDGSAMPSRASSDSSPVWYSLAVLPADYGVLCWSFVLLAAQTPFTIVYSVLAAVNLALLSLALPRWYREMRSYTRTARS
ncbi:MAG: CDP-alcohol phosphatidyltransferase family protein [Acidimicrobiia bacterium]|nr:CDP-alcohol phosphatidyltransferase family protein [Acidimicrobiia bacterium]